MMWTFYRLLQPNQHDKSNISRDRLINQRQIILFSCDSFRQRTENIFSVFSYSIHYNVYVPRSRKFVSLLYVMFLFSLLLLFTLGIFNLGLRPTSWTRNLKTQNNLRSRSLMKWNRTFHQLKMMNRIDQRCQRMDESNPKQLTFKYSPRKK